MLRIRGATLCKVIEKGGDISKFSGCRPLIVKIFRVSPPKSWTKTYVPPLILNIFRVSPLTSNIFSKRKRVFDQIICYVTSLKCMLHTTRNFWPIILYVMPLNNSCDASLLTFYVYIGDSPFMGITPRLFWFLLGPITPRYPLKKSQFWYERGCYRLGIWLVGWLISFSSWSWV